MTETRTSDLGTPEFVAKNAIVVSVTQEGRRQARNTIQNPLDWYHIKSIIDRRQYDAGQRFWLAFVNGGTAPKYVITNLDPSPRSPNPSSGEGAETVYKDAISSIRGIKETKAVMHVVCYGEMLSSLNICGINRRTHYLKSGLDDLAKHFGIR